MKQYGAKKATEFTSKQISVIYFKAKNGKLNIEKWFMNELYNLAEYYGYDDNGSVADSERSVLEILEAVFASNFETAQELINKTTDKWYSLYGKKTQSKCNREVFVA